MRDQLIPFLVAILIAQTVAMASLIVAPDILFSVPQHHQHTQNDSGRGANKENPAADGMSFPFRVGKFLDDHNGAINAIATVAIAGLTIALVIFNRSLVRLVLRQTEDARQVSERQASETKDQLAITKQAADAAEGSAIAAEKQARILESNERPYLLIKTVIPSINDNIYGFLTAKRFPSVSCTIKNYGRSVAVLKIAGSQLRTTRDTPPGTLSSPPAYPLVLEGGKEHSFQVPFGGAGEAPLSEGAISRIKDGRGFLWLHFHIMYNDVTGAAHETLGKWKYNFFFDNFVGDPQSYDKIT